MPAAIIEKGLRHCVGLDDAQASRRRWDDGLKVNLQCDVPACGVYSSDSADKGMQRVFSLGIEPRGSYRHVLTRRLRTKT